MHQRGASKIALSRSSFLMGNGRNFMGNCLHVEAAGMSGSRSLTCMAAKGECSPSSANCIFC